MSSETTQVLAMFRPLSFTQRLGIALRLLLGNTIRIVVTQSGLTSLTGAELWMIPGEAEVGLSVVSVEDGE